MDKKKATARRGSWASFLPQGTPQSGAVKTFAARYALVGVLLLTIALFSFLMPDIFFTYGNLKTVLGSQALLVLLAIGIMMPLTMGQFDVSGPAVLSLSCVAVAALTERFGLPTPVAILIALSISVFVGCLNAFFVVKVGINSIIATLGTWTIIDGALAGYLGSRLVTGTFPKSLMEIGQGTVLGLPLPVLYALGVILAAWYALEHTPFGRHAYAIGQSPQAARLAGIHVRRTTAMSFLISSFLCGVAGIVAMAQLGVGHPRVGEPFLFPALTAVFFGAASIKIGSFNVIGTVVGIMFIATVVVGLRLAGVPPWTSYLVHGGGLIVALALVRYLNGEPV